MTDFYPTGAPSKNIILTGKLIPSSGDGPVLLVAPKQTATIREFYYLPCFSDIEKLRDFMNLIKIEYSAVKQITETFEFIDDMKNFPFVKIIVDPYFTLEGKIRFNLILEDEKNTN